MKSQERLNKFFDKYTDLGNINDGNSVLSWLLHSHAEGDDLDKGTVVREMLLAGQVTLSAAASTLIVILHHYPTVRERLSKDINEEFNTSNVYEELSSKRLESIQYLDWVVKEVLRLHPPAGGFFREAKETIIVGVRNAANIYILSFNYINIIYCYHVCLHFNNNAFPNTGLSDSKRVDFVDVNL